MTKHVEKAFPYIFNNIRLICICSVFLCFSYPSMTMTTNSNKRVPAEWEPQAATWLQWPGRHEKIYEPAFARFSAIISRYQPLHILVNSHAIKKEAVAAFAAATERANTDRITWHTIKNNNAWMRDNGPIYITENNQLTIQNWEFDAWGGAFGKDVVFKEDNKIPQRVGEFLNIPVEQVNIVHERGNLEFNGIDTVIVNWSTLGDPDRNPSYTREQAEIDLKSYFGISNVIFVEGILEGDLTRGHIDGIARFINVNTVVIPQCTAQSLCGITKMSDAKVYDTAAKTIESFGISVIRDPIEGYVNYKGALFDATYMNWLVGNGFVITVGFADEKLDNAAKKRLESYFPNRDIYVVNMLDSWYAGGGVHCHTNDQPAI